MQEPIEFEPFSIIPTAVTDFILMMAIADDEVTHFVVSQVCREWRIFHPYRNLLQYEHSSLGLLSCLNLTTEAAERGWLQVLIWLREQLHFPWDEGTCSAAARWGRLDVLKWLRANGCPWNVFSCVKAAEGGQLEVLKWLKENGCEWNTYTCEKAAKEGHLEVLKWLRANGCPWSIRTSRAAARKGHEDVLKWAIENGCPFRPEGRPPPAQVRYFPW